jgi:hypothetical protein
MDAHCFDAFARTLSVGASRRGLGRLLGGLAIAGGIVGHSTRFAEGKNGCRNDKNKKKDKEKKKKKKCSADCFNTCCDGNCVNTPTDRNNCGACGNVCVPGQYCANGTCVTCDKSICTIGLAEYCVDLQTDRENCGSCGIVCQKDSGGNPQRDLVCSAGACICTGTTCPTSLRCCPAGYVCNRDDGCCPEGGDYCGGGQCCPRGFKCGGNCGQPCCAV